jgi:hypothetical protein
MVHNPVISFQVHGDFNKLDGFLEKMKEGMNAGVLDKYGKIGVDALRLYTPKDTGLTSESWKYRIVRNSQGTAIEWYNTNVQDNVHVAVVLQYGHATKSGTFIEGIDYINPAMRPVFEEIATKAWKEVTTE